MNHWVLAFVGDGATRNLETTRGTGSFYVSSNRTPIRRARPGDRTLLYLVRKGFVAEATLATAAVVPSEPAAWSSKGPREWGVTIRDTRSFPAPIPYDFPEDGRNATLGFHRRALTGGFLAIPRTGFDDVLARAGTVGIEPPPAPSTLSPEEDAAREFAARGTPGAETVNDGTTGERQGHEGREKRVAGQHAMREGRKRAALWTVAEVVSGTFGLKGIERHALGKARKAEKTWVAGGRAEARVGEELEKLRSHGFYLFHDLPLTGLGNVDHVALGPRGFFAIETKSHRGTVRGRGRDLLVNDRVPEEKDFVAQAWRGAYRLRDILESEVVPILCFAEARVEGGCRVRGVRVLPLRWLVGEVLRTEARRDAPTVKEAVSALSAATGCHPSAAPRA
jgi:hypothetical protein